MCEECQGKRLQRKLTIGSSNDPLEAEADRVADQVLATPAHSIVSSSPPRIQRFTGQSTGDAGTAPASVDRVLSGSGSPLDLALRHDMEQRFGHDFSTVRVHAGEAAEQSARDVNANAYTVGHNVVFGVGRFAPGTHEGRRLLAHELAHVVQQSGVDGNCVSQSNEKRGLSPISGRHAEPAMIASTLQRQSNPTPLSSQQLDPIRADENSNAYVSFSFKQLTIFVPKAVIFGFRKEITDLKVHVFFAAAGVQRNQANDVLTHGLRGASDNSMWVLIAAPGVPGGAFLVSDQDIRDCLNAVGIKTPIQQLRLSGHSRGGDSLVTSIVQKKITALSLIDHIFILDADSVQSGKVDRVPQLISMGIPASKITAYEVNVHAGTRTKGATFIDLAPGCMAAIGYVRLIQDSMVTKLGIAALVNANPDITSQLASLPLPPRGKFASGTPTAKQTSIQGFCKQHASAINTILSNESKPGKGLLHFINTNNLVRFRPFQFSRGISAHHFFVAEIAHELTD